MLENKLSSLQHGLRGQSEPSARPPSRSVRNVALRSSLQVLLVCLTVVACGCSTVGPLSVRGDRFKYNQAGARSGNEQMLLNIVRLRYGEPIYYLDIGSMLSQYTLEAGANLGGWDSDIDVWNSPTLRAIYGVRSDPGSQDSWGVNLNYSDRPTITYTPLQGEAFATRIMSPIPPATVFLLAQSGWSIDRLLECCVQRMNGVSNVPIHDIHEADFWSTVKFRTISKLLKQLQDQGRMKTEIEIDPNNRKMYLHTSQDVAGFEEEAKELAELLNLAEGLTRIEVYPGGHQNADNELIMVTRSLLGVLNALAQTIPAPEEHMEDGQVLTRAKTDEPSDTVWLHVEHARVPSTGAFVQVYYNGYWWHIQKTDWNSKRTFALLSYLFSLQASETGIGVPMVTVGAGG